MEPSFNINRPPVSDDEIEKHKNFDALVAQFKKQSLKKARGDESWWKNKKVQYTSVILGVTVVCTVTWQSLNQQQKSKTNQKATNGSITTTKTRHNTTTKPAARYVAPPLASLDKKRTSYKVNNQEGARIVHPGATRINVPKGVFVDKKGEEIIGEVTVEYREFHELPEIIGAGIPMRHDSAGRTHHLETAGMFEIRAQKDGEPVMLKKNVPITVDLASRNREDRFYQYYLDTVSRNWRYTGPDVPVTEKPARAHAAPGPAAPANESVKRDSLLHIYHTRISRLPDPVKPSMPAKHRKGRPTFVLEGSYDEFPELAAFDNVLFEVGPENENYTPELHDITWSDIKISQGTVKGHNYFLTLIYRNRKERLLVYPVLKEKDYEKARARHNERLADYEAKLDEKKKKEDALRKELEEKQEALAQAERSKKEPKRSSTADARIENNRMSSSVQARRLFQVTNFGIYNSDHPHSIETASAVVPDFVDAENKRVVKPEVIYIIDHVRKTVITSNDPSNVIFPAKGKADYSMCVVSGGSVYTCDRNSFAFVLNEGGRTFSVKRQEGAGSTIGDFRKALDL